MTNDAFPLTVDPLCSLLGGILMIKLNPEMVVHRLQDSSNLEIPERLRFNSLRCYCMAKVQHSSHAMTSKADIWIMERPFSCNYLYFNEAVLCVKEQLL